ncbi:MAG: hypothetical protein OEM52_06115 [bacterium]|nr:hypothetical protein [bacterium]
MDLVTTLPSTGDIATHIVELNTERYGAKFRTMVRLSNGEEHEAIADNPQESESQIMKSLSIAGWNVGLF